MSSKADIVLLLCFGVPGCGASLVGLPLDSGGAANDAPTVIFTVPADAAMAVALTSSVSATFSKAMNPATINATTFTLRQGATPVSGAVTFDDTTNTGTLTPYTALALNQLYTSTVTAEAGDTEGRALVADFVWSFATGSIEFSESTATAQAVPAPDYTLDVGALNVITDANNVVQTVAGTANLTAGPVPVTGQQYVVVNAAGLRTYAAIDAAFSAGSKMVLTLNIPAADFTLMSVDLTIPQRSTLVVANEVNKVASYQAFEITFHPAF